MSCTVRRVCSSLLSFQSPSIVSSCWRKMSDHIVRTADSFRHPGVSAAEVVEMEQASETVKLLKLKIEDPTFNFKAGQWVDMIIPRVTTIGGFSMSSGPKDLHEKGWLGLAIKYSPHPPAHWVHKECTVGSKVMIRVGGDKLIYDPQPGDPPWNVLLIAGGIGINPLLSMMLHCADLRAKRGDDAAAYTPGRMELLYSAATMNDLIFKDTIEEVKATHSPAINAQFFVTRESEVETSVSARRIAAADIKSSLDRLGMDPLRCYICGPPPMIADMETMLRDQGIRDEDVFCEKWW